MSEADIAIGAVSGSGPTVLDYWSTSENTPSADTSLGGTNDIISFTGQQVSGKKK